MTTRAATATKPRGHVIAAIVGSACMLLALYYAVIAYPQAKALLLGTTQAVWPAINAIVLAAAWAVYGLFTFQPDRRRWAALTLALAVMGLSITAFGLDSPHHIASSMLMILTSVLWWPKRPTNPTS